MPAEVAQREALRQLSVKELKEVLREEGFDPSKVTGLEKDELVEQIVKLKLNPVQEDEFPLPLYSNCWPQFVLRGLLLAAVQLFACSYFVSWLVNCGILLLLVAVLVVRNVLIIRTKAVKRRKRL
mmetsp:Transcript_96780/g.273471  ORF Transcript_96780/g.273471 Transcript_96780/m.273471 type:complete len:125 (-) Transcript_96780:84-458(-)|eukprot:CAMPEP_0117537490 /NCGR_PEP_ID=MMETSP0784-20121206/41991_1 /TAXON_ID=39447 /ORGANISM="" /LENGTH=124 /DNA_ID=CAMNT_0005334077 /DNA_START=141 /DNA_END=515 /DNA_ORIENTATION=-